LEQKNLQSGALIFFSNQDQAAFDAGERDETGHHSAQTHILKNK